MSTEQQILSEEQIAEIEALSAKVPDGPWFTVTDDADDVPDHRRSGLALVETGRSADWWIARLCEWHIANFIAASKTNMDALCQTVRALLQEQREGEICEFCDEMSNLPDGSPRTFLVCGACWNENVEANRVTITGLRDEAAALQSRLSEVTKERDDLKESLKQTQDERDTARTVVTEMTIQKQRLEQELRELKGAGMP